MKTFLTSLVGAGVALLMAGAATAQTFSHFETTTAPGNTYFSISGNSSVLFLPGSDTNADCSGPGTDIVFAELDVSSSSATDDAFNAPYQIDMNITDDASAASAVLTFTGTLTGAVRGNPGPQSNLNNTFGPNQTQNVVLGGTVYTVTIGPYTPPGPAGGTRRGAIGAHVTCAPVIPEPGTLALLGAGALPLVGLARRRRN